VWIAIILLHCCFLHELSIALNFPWNSSCAIRDFKTYFPRVHRDMKKWHCFSHVDALFLKEISASEWFGLRAGKQFVGCGHCWSGWRQNVPTLTIISHLPCDNIHISAHVDPMNILQHQVFSDCTCGSHEYITASSAFRLHVHPMNIWQQQMNSYCTCTSHEYITAANNFLLDMYIQWIYYCIECFPTAHVHPINRLHHQVISYRTCTSHEYITAAIEFLLHMYIPGIYYSSKWFPTGHVHPMNILLHWVFSYCTCTSHK
jgi:hypothetical protein